MSKGIRNIVQLWWIILMVLGCHRSNDQPGYVYQPDMTYSRAVETFSNSGDIPDSVQIFQPVVGTVPLHMKPYRFRKNQSDRLRAGTVFFNELNIDDTIISKGKKLYLLVCNQCHGESLDGNGYFFTEELYPYQPRSLVSEALRAAPDGELFHVITVGFNLMGAHGSMLSPEERWEVVSYIRYAQNNK